MNGYIHYYITQRPASVAKQIQLLDSVAKYIKLSLHVRKLTACHVA